MKSLGNKNSKIVYSKEGVHEIDTNLIEKQNFSLSNSHIIELARYVLLLEKNYSELFNKKIGVDIEWALDGLDKQISRQIKTDCK